MHSQQTPCSADYGMQITGAQLHALLPVQHMQLPDAELLMLQGRIAQGLDYERMSPAE